MSASIWLNRGAWLLVVGVSAAWFSWSLVAAEGDSSEPKPRAKTVHRLPPYFGDVVSEKQRETIYSLQDEYAPQLEQLKEQMRLLVAERDAKIHEVLDADQKTKVEELRAAAKAARAKKIADEDDEDATTPEAAPATTPAPATATVPSTAPVPATTKPATTVTPTKPATPATPTKPAKPK